MNSSYLFDKNIFGTKASDIFIQDYLRPIIVFLADSSDGTVSIDLEKNFKKFSSEIETTLYYKILSAAFELEKKDFISYLPTIFNDLFGEAYTNGRDNLGMLSGTKWNPANQPRQGFALAISTEKNYFIDYYDIGEKVKTDLNAAIDANRLRDATYKKETFSEL